MFIDDPFTPETVDERVTDLIEESSYDDRQRQANHNQNLIQNLQHLYGSESVNSSMFEKAKKSVFQRLDEKTHQSNAVASENTRQVIPKMRTLLPRKKAWRLNLLIAVIVVVVISLSATFFMFSQWNIIPAQESDVSSNGQGTSGLAISIQPQPFIYGTDLYVNTGNDIRAYAVKTGTPTRIYKTANTGNPMVMNGILYTSGIGSTFAMHLSDGKMLWQSPLGSQNSTPPTVVNNVLYGCTYKSVKTVYALKASNGSVLWQYHVTNQDKALTSPIVVQNTVYFISYTPGLQSVESHVYALNTLNGTPRWQHPLGHTATPILQTDGLSLYTIVDGYVEALRTNNGEVYWRYKLPLSSSAEINKASIKSIAKGILFVTKGDGSIDALSTASGTLLWQYQTHSGTLFGSFNVEGNAVYAAVLTTDNPRSSVIIAIQINTGHRLWQTLLAQQEVAFPTIQEGTIYTIYGGEGHMELFTLSAVDGHVLWHRTLYSLV